MDKLAAYIKERENAELIEVPEGFIAYKIIGLECFVCDIFIFKEFRRTKKASELGKLVEKIGKENKCLYLTGTVCLDALNANESLKFLLGYGMIIHSCKNSLILFKKEI